MYNGHDGNLLDGPSRARRASIARWVIQLTVLICAVGCILVAYTLRMRSLIAKAESQYRLLQQEQQEGEQPVIDPTQPKNKQINRISRFVDKHTQAEPRPLQFLQALEQSLLPNEEIAMLSMQKQEASVQVVLINTDRITPFLKKLSALSGYKNIAMTSVQIREHRVYVQLSGARAGKKGKKKEGQEKNQGATP